VNLMRPERARNETRTCIWKLTGVDGVASCAECHPSGENITPAGEAACIRSVFVYEL